MYGGSDSVVYELNYLKSSGILNVWQVGAFGDSTLIKSFKDRRDRGITLEEMLENIKELSELTYKEFKEKVLEKGE